MQIKDLKKGDFFRLSETSKKTYIKGNYDRATKKYECTDFDDFCHTREFKGNKNVFVDFIF